MIMWITKKQTKYDKRNKSVIKINTNFNAVQYNDVTVISVMTSQTTDSSTDVVCCMAMARVSKIWVAGISLGSSVAERLVKTHAYMRR